MESKRFCVPANEGWFLCHPVKGDDGRFYDFQKDSIVAWIVFSEGISEIPGGHRAESFPVTASGPVSDESDYAILSPDGSLEVPGVAVGLTKPEALKIMNDD